MYSQNPILHLSYNENNGNTTALNSSGTPDFQILNTFNKPDRVAGVAGNALRLDGFSTWATANFTYNFNRKMTVETWVSMECYPNDAENVNNNQLLASSLITQTLGETGYRISIDTYGTWWFQVTIAGQTYYVFAPNKFPLYKWTHVAGVVDGPNNKILLYLNGQEVANANIPSTGSIEEANAPMFIGKTNQDKERWVGNFLINAINAAIDETKIYAEVKSKYQIYQTYLDGQMSAATTGFTATVVQESRFSHDINRPTFHAMPPANWTNEPHGFITDPEGKYHLFYQRTANGPFKFRNTWGHITSPDLVTWTNQRDALRPELTTINGVSNFDTKGIWSGDAIVENGSAYSFYTCVSTTGGLYNPGIALAKSSDKGFNYWEKLGPIIPKEYVDDFRDPYLWKEGNTYHMIIGAKIAGQGSLSYYTSTDPQFLSWQHQGTFSNVLTQMDPSSEIWEMPIFEPLANNKYVLIVNPIGGTRTRFGENATRGVYWIGTWDGSKFTPDQTTHKNLDIIWGHLSPAVTRKSNGDLVAIGIVDERRNSASQLASGWAHTYSLPRVYSLMPDNKSLGQSPDPALKDLRDLTTFQRVRNLSVNGELPISISGRASEIIMKIDTTSTGTKYGFNFYVSQDRSEMTRLYYDTATKEFKLDKSKSSLSTDVFEKTTIFGTYDEAVYGKPHKIQVFLDHSVIDVFINDHAVFSNRVYTTLPDSDGIELYSEGGTTVFEVVKAWQLKQGEKEVEEKEVPAEHSYLNFNFEMGNLSGWTATGTAFSLNDVVTDADWGWGGPFGKEGNYHLWGFKEGGDTQIGTLTSQNFTISGDGIIKFKIGGGNNIDNLYLALVVSNLSGEQEIKMATGTDYEGYSDVIFDASAYIGQNVKLRLVDTATGSFGHINLDDVRIPINTDYTTFNFESGNLFDWAVNGEAFSNGDVTQDINWGWGGTFGKEGNYHLWGFKEGGDTQTGTLFSKQFIIGGNGRLSYKIAGGDDFDNLYLSLIVLSENGYEEIKMASGHNSEAYVDRQFDASQHIGKKAFLKVVDKSTSTSYGHLNLDDIKIPKPSEFINEPESSSHLLEYNFESGDLQGWTVEGNAFSVLDVTTENNWGWGGPFNHEGNYHLWSFKDGGDSQTGSLSSEKFVLGGNGNISFKISGGNNINDLYLALMVQSETGFQEIKMATGQANEAYLNVQYDASDYTGKVCYLKLVDNATGGFGHINLDHVSIPISAIFESFNFESGDLSNWLVESGDAFSNLAVSNAVTYWGGPFNNEGLYHLHGAKVGDDKIGTMRTPNFILAGNGIITLKLGGGYDIDKVYVSVVATNGDFELLRLSGNDDDSEMYLDKSFNLSNLLGENIYIKVVDSATGAWGHINLDDVSIPIMPTVLNTAKTAQTKSLLSYNSQSELEFKIYPNPVTDFVNVEVPAKFQNTPIQIQLYSVDGKLTLQKQFLSNEKVDISNIPSGFYIGHVVWQQKAFTFKLIKN